MRGSIRVIVAGMALMLVAAACSSDSSSTSSSSGAANGQQGGTFSVANCEPSTSLIPSNNYESCGTQVFEVIYEPLMAFDDNGELIGAQAESVTPSSDGLTYTIKIKSGWTFHNGDPVTAQDYVNAWNYAADCTNGYLLNAFFDKIKGYDDLNPSDCKDLSTHEMSGLTVKDETTFDVELTAPFSQFPVTLTFDAYDALPKAFFDDPDAFNEQPIGNGPYMMDGKWKHDDTINVVRYPDYAGTPGNADAIHLTIYAIGGNASWNDFQAGNVDLAAFGSDHLAELEQNYADSLQKFTSTSFLYLGFPMYDPKFQSKELRQALSMAVDRQSVMTAILINEHPADDMMPPSIPGYRAGACKYCTLDVAGAQQKLEAAGGWSGTMNLNIYADDPVLEQAAEAITNQWKQNLGIDVNINAVPYNSWYGNTLNQKWDGPWFLDGWVMDYPSMENYLTPLYGTNGPYNTSGYSNKQFDDLLKQGDEASSVDASTPLYQQADDIVLEDLPVIPWGFGGFNSVNQPTITNVVKDGPFDQWALEKVQVVQ
jgi:ABC-type oligopeptide transport system substrate-binding subunit